MNAQEKLLNNRIDKVEAFSFPKTLSPLRKVAMLLFNMIPALQVASFIAFIYLLPQTPIIKLTLATTLLMLLPPLTSLIVLRLSNIKNKTIIIGSNDYLIWWFLLCQQTLFSRLSFLEECIRMIPGLYSLWLRLWGSQVGSLTYWAPGTRIFDRGFLNIGNNVILGAGTRLSPHVIIKDDSGNFILHLDTITIEDNSVIGGYSLLTAGTRILKGSATRAFTISPPNSIWKDSKRVKS